MMKGTKNQTIKEQMKSGDKITKKLDDKRTKKNQMIKEPKKSDDKRTKKMR